MRESTKKIQQGLIDLGYDLGIYGADGFYGPVTERALRQYMNNRGSRASQPEQTTPNLLPRLPWIEEAKTMFGLHETQNNRKLREWLSSDGRYLGNPDEVPWCGDFVQTAIRLSIPNEPFNGPLGQNQYWARNWLYFGRYIKPCYGCVLVFSRGSGGHVGFAVGEDNLDYYVLGGNQDDSVNISRISKSRLILDGSRWPSTYVGGSGFMLPRMTANNIPKSENEF